MTAEMGCALRKSGTHKAKDEKSELTVGRTQYEDLPETHSHCVDGEAPNHHKPCPDTPIWEIFLIFDRRRSDRPGICLCVPVFLARFFLDREHRGGGGRIGSGEPVSGSGPLSSEFS